LEGVVGQRDGNGKFDTSGKSPASVHHPRRHAKIDAIDPKRFVGGLEAKP
jgi:hypothetical protein